MRQREIFVLGLDDSASELQALFAQLGTEAEEAYVTTADMLRAEGEARAEARGRAEALVQLLTLKFGPLQPAVLDIVLDIVHSASIDQLETWTARVLTADTLNDVLNRRSYVRNERD